MNYRNNFAVKTHRHQIVHHSVNRVRLYPKVIVKDTTIHLEIPFDNRDAKRRAIDPSLCKIIYECQTNDNNICISRIATAIDRCCSEEHSKYITAVGEFLPINALEVTDGIKIIEKTNLVNAKSRGGLENVLINWDAEALVIFFSDKENAITIVSNVTRLQSAWWRYRRGSYDQDFLSQIELCGLFIFYSSTHRSIEIIGYEDHIHNCYTCLQEGE